MTHIDTDTIRRRPDGSIDTSYYLDRGRRKRSETAHRIARNGAKRPGTVLTGLFAFLASLPFLGEHG